MLHLHPRPPQEQDARITIHLYNRSDRFQDVTVAGHVYTVMSHEALTIKGPEGTGVFAASKGFSHRSGELLFSLTADHNGTTVPLD